MKIEKKLLLFSINFYFWYGEGAISNIFIVRDCFVFDVRFTANINIYKVILILRLCTHLTNFLLPLIVCLFIAIIKRAKGWNITRKTITQKSMKCLKKTNHFECKH